MSDHKTKKFSDKIYSQNGFFFSTENIFKSRDHKQL